MFSLPRMCLKYSFLMAKFEANIDAVSFRQSVQLQTNVLTSPGPSTGFGKGSSTYEESSKKSTYECQLDCSAKTCCCCQTIFISSICSNTVVCYIRLALIACCKPFCHIANSTNFWTIICLILTSWIATAHSADVLHLSTVTSQYRMFIHLRHNNGSLGTGFVERRCES